MENEQESDGTVRTEPQEKSYTLTSTHMAERIPLKKVVDRYLDRLVKHSPMEAVFRLSAESWFWTYNFGAVSFFNVEPAVQAEIVSALQQMSRTVTGDPLSDDFRVVVDPEQREGVSFDKVVLTEISQQKVEILALVLAHSVTLDYYESVVEELLDQAETIISPMKATGSLPRYSRSTIRYIGISLSTRRDLISWLYIVDAPDEAWEDRGIDRLFTQMKSNMDIDVRYRAVEYKLKLIQEGVEVIADLSNAARNIVLEFIIVLLIVVELVLALYRGH